MNNNFKNQVSELNLNLNSDLDFDSDYELEKELFDSNLFVKSNLNTDDKDLVQQKKDNASKAIDVAKSSIEKSDSINKKNKEAIKKKFDTIECDLARKNSRKSILKILLIVLLLIYIINCFFNEPIKEMIKYKNFRYSIKNKLCNNSVFIKKHFNDQDNCCQHIFYSICDESYIADSNVERECKKFDSFKPFLQSCIYKIELADFYDLIEKMFTPLFI